MLKEKKKSTREQLLSNSKLFGRNRFQILQSGGTLVRSCAIKQKRCENSLESVSVLVVEELDEEEEEYGIDTVELRIARLLAAKKGEERDACGAKGRDCKVETLKRHGHSKMYTRYRFHLAVVCCAASVE